MRWMLGSLAVTVVLVAANLAPVQGQQAQVPDNSAAAKGAEPGSGVAPSEIKAPWDFAPPEQVIVGREPQSFRKEGTLLAGTSREIPKVDQKELLERKYAMYGDQRFYSRPSRPADAAARGKEPAAALVQAFEGRSFHWLPWALGALIAGVVLVAWRKGWFVPFSARTAEQRTSRVASARSRSRAAKGPPRKIRPR